MLVKRMTLPSGSFVLFVVAALSSTYMNACKEKAGSPGFGANSSGAGSGTTGPVVASSTAAPAASSKAAKVPLQRWSFATPALALGPIFERKPRVIGFGETHAPKGATVASSTARFRDVLLPALAPKSSAIILELWFTLPQCNQKQVAQVASAQREVTKHQAEENQNEFVDLFKKSVKLGLKSHVLVPTCDDYGRILDAGAGDIATMLELIARLAGEKGEKLSVDPDGMPVLLYGGAIHNDLEPANGRGTFSFGPRLDNSTGHRYVEVDLIVPEFVGNDEIWQGQPWYGMFDPKEKRTETLLLEVHKNSFVLVFPPTAT